MNEANELFKRYRAGKCTPKEKQLLHKWFHHLREDETSELTEDDLLVAQKILQENMNSLIRKRRGTNLWIRLVAATVTFMIISFGIYFYVNYSDKNAIQHVNRKIPNDISPGGNKATLTLADGRKISLTDAVDGNLAEQSGIKVIKAADGHLIYILSDSNDPSPTTSYNTIETPIGGQYQITLPDGSKVWLNSSSSLRYPVRFMGRERKVEITGEAYFEVAHNSSMPFKVISSDQIVEVLGTHFNIMAYHDEVNTNTTLLEGSVRITKENKSEIILPGQQARMRDGNLEIVNVDINGVVAWKNGYFVFKNEGIENIMRQISRWYNVKVEYKGNVSGKVFGGKISRSRNISEVLDILELTGSIDTL